jgi:outer membrane receptor for ferrienterochelin and colicin
MNKKLAVLWVVVFSLFFSLESMSQATSAIGGVVVNKNSQAGLPGISIQLTPGGKSAISDSVGNFRIAGIIPGTYAISFSGIGFQPKTISNLVVTSGNEVTLQVELEPQASQLNTIVVSGRKNSARVATIESPLSIQRLTTEDIKANPGGNFDISKVIQSLPGVGGGIGGGSFRNDIIIRGGSPSENVFYLDGIEVPIINHFSTQGSGGGPQGILNVSFIEDVRLSTSAFDARYDNALSSVFQFKQKAGNANRLQGNIRMSASEVAATFDGPLSKNTTFLASARRSYLQLLFQAIDLPIRPNYWDFQFKTTTKIDKKTTLSFLGIGAIDEFSFAAPKEATPEKLYVINSSPAVNQNSYTIGTSLKRLTDKGFINISLSRNLLNNRADKYLDNKNPVEADRTFRINSTETENKFRFDVNNTYGEWKLSYGATAQLVEFDNSFFQIVSNAVKDAQGNIIKPAIALNSSSDVNFLRYGAFVQAGRRLLNNRLGLSVGLRTDANNNEKDNQNLLKQMSPRVSLSYAITDKWNISASYGQYFRLPSFTQMAFTTNINGQAFSNPDDYIKSTHWVAGFEFLPSSTTRFTIEGFYKRYNNYPVSVIDGISLGNKGTEFGAIGNEPVVQNGKGRVWGLEFFAQQKLTQRFFGVFSYTFYRSEFSGLNGKFVPANWDNRHLISATLGYKFKRNWELGLKFRYQGEAPYTPYNLEQSRVNYHTLGTGVFNFDQVNTLRLPAFHSGDLRIDKKWNYRKLTLDLFLDITNFYSSKSAGVPNYTFKRTADNTSFESTDGQPVRMDGSNATPVLLQNLDGTLLPTIGFIIEF